MYYAILLTEELFLVPPPSEELIVGDISKAVQLLKKYPGSRMKTFKTFDGATDFLEDPERYSFNKSITGSPIKSIDLIASLENLSLENSPTASSTKTSTPTKIKPPADEAEPIFESAKPPMLNNLRRKIESGDYEAVESIIWSNPRSLITCSDSAIYLMAGPKYNAAHIAARANKPDIMALILDTVTNLKYVRKLYPNESDNNLQDRVNHLLDSYLNTPDPRQGNTPLHFACKLGHYRVVRVLLTFEGCDLTLRDFNGLTAQEGACSLYESTGDEDVSKIKDKISKLFKRQLCVPAHRDQLRKRLTMERRRRSKLNLSMDSSLDTSFSDIDESFIITPNDNSYNNNSNKNS